MMATRKYFNLLLVLLRVLGSLGHGKNLELGLC